MMEEVVQKSVYIEQSSAADLSRILSKDLSPFLRCAKNSQVQPR